MKYDFTTVYDRRGKDAVAIDEADHFYHNGAVLQEGFDQIPMWIADMNFATAPSIPQAMIERAKNPLYGYFPPRDEYYKSIIRWQLERNHVEGLTREKIGYENGVLGGLGCAMRVLCSMGDKVLINSPTYVGFTNHLNNAGYKIVHSPMYRDEQGIWRMDFEDMERKIKENHIHAAVFCSPHNPTGRVWERWEIEKAMEVYQRHNVYVISDEIWSDLIHPGYHHIPTQSVSEDAKMRTIAFYAPSKTFNLAGMVGAYRIVYNPWLRDRMDKEGSLTQYNTLNLMSMYALMGGYSETGAEWLDELCTVLQENAKYACDFIEQNLEGVTAARPQGTYMLFADCTEWCEKHHKTMDEVLNAGYNVGILWQDGREFQGPHSIRMNLALPLSRVKEAFARMKEYVFV